jgi:hypothetical protein
MTDFYLENPERLNGQPKRTIADYVEQNGVLVPRRFDSLAEARKSHRPILLRSEHPQEYDGVSGLLDSFSLSRKFSDYNNRNKKTRKKFSPRGMTSIDDIAQSYLNFKSKNRGCPLFIQYCALLEIEVDDFRKEVSLSIWERLGGLNRTVVADTAIKGRYHILTNNGKHGEDWLVNYVMIEDGKVVTEHVKPLPDEQRALLPNLVEIYEKVRDLSNFDSNHCPIMEFQTVDNKHYFLQYHRTRDFSEAEFVLDREAKKGEVEASFVRGATPAEGMVVNTTLLDGDWNSGKDYIDHSLPIGEEGSFDFHYLSIKSEILVRNRKLQVIEKGHVSHLFLELGIDHEQKSKIFKPQVSIVTEKRALRQDEKELEELFEKAHETGEDQKVPIYVISDGRRAFVSRI